MEFDRQDKGSGDKPAESVEGSGIEDASSLPDEELFQLDAELGRPPGGYAHEWDWSAVGVPVHVDDEMGIAWVRISECPPDEQAALRDWVDGEWLTRPVIDGLDPQDAVYVWDYALFQQERSER